MFLTELSSPLHYCNVIDQSFQYAEQSLPVEDDLFFKPVWKCLKLVVITFGHPGRQRQILTDCSLSAQGSSPSHCPAETVWVCSPGWSANRWVSQGWKRNLWTWPISFHELLSLFYQAYLAVSADQRMWIILMAGNVKHSHSYMLQN